MLFMKEAGVEKISQKGGCLAGWRDRCEWNILEWFHKFLLRLARWKIMDYDFKIKGIASASVQRKLFCYSNKIRQGWKNISLELA